jgi:hypothetical protein
VQGGGWCGKIFRVFFRHLRRILQPGREIVTET